MQKRLAACSAALILAIAGCGGPNPAGTGDGGTAAEGPDQPATQPPVMPAPGNPGSPSNPGNPGTQPGGPIDVNRLRSEVEAAYRAVTSIRADYETRQTRGSQSYFARVKMTFAKPRKLRLDIKQSSDALLNGAIVVWTGGATIKGRKDIGFIPIKQEHKLSDKPNLRGWLYDQTDFDAAVTSAVNNLARARVLGNSKIGNATVLLVEFKSTLPGAAIERIGIDTSRKLPIYREFRETAGGKPVFTLTYSNIVLNQPVPASTFEIF